ncbi:hypothetical protein BDW02DRAFT_165832 [Decorospora gaudefroyi]|uniref:F-box domain-containing protein n=1 Tax=Decorospora gaudefroyi TaxID=184978 RepID=A0A6A5JX88_9PLEO|nr:hypothetical protein BDW02DRAFT_165832 [Decorospora gaudefroyi]
MSTTDGAFSGLLSLPTELRCHIYDYLLADPHAITISAGYITCFGNRIQDLARKTDIPGLPLYLAPLARRHHDACLLSVAKPPTIAVENGHMDNIEGEKLGYPAPLALLLTSRLINDELTDYMRGRRRIAQTHSSTHSEMGVYGDAEDKEGLSLYVSYPYGVLVLKSLYPFLLKQARRIYISGYYTAPQDNERLSTVSVLPDTSDGEHLTPSSSFAAASFSTPTSGPTLGLHRSSNNNNHPPRRIARHGVSVHSSRPRLRLDPPPPREERHASRTTNLFPSFSKATSTLALAALSHLVRTVLPQGPTQLVQLSARILYPGEDTYCVVWSDGNSPVTHILRNICGGNIDMKVKRGDLGTGMRLEARPKPDARVVSTSWETWKARNRTGSRARTGGRMGVADMDHFLSGEESV